MTMEEEIEDAVRNGANPLFLFGLVAMASEGAQEVEFLSETINRVGQKIYLEGGDGQTMV